MATEERVLELEKQLEALRVVVTKGEQETEAAVQDARAAHAEIDRIAGKSQGSPMSEFFTRRQSPVEERMVYLTQPRRLDRFRGKPEKSTDISVEEWVEDAEAILG